MTGRDARGAAVLARLHAVLDELATVDVEAELLESLPAGAALAGLLFVSEPTLLVPEAQLTFVEQVQRLINALEARRDLGIVAFAGSNPRHTSYWVNGDERHLTDVRSAELALALRWPEGFTHQRIDSARAQVTLPQTANAFRAGLLSTRAVDAIANGVHSLTGPIDDAIATAVKTKCDPAQVDDLRELRQQMCSTFDAKVSAFAVRHNPLRIGDKIRTTIASLDPEGAAARRVIAARVKSNVEFRLLPDGLAQLTATLAADQALACMRAIDHRAQDGDGVDPTDPIGLRRAQAFVQFVTRSAVGHAPVALAGDDAAAMASAHPSAKRSTVGAHVDVVMDLPTFLGLGQTPALLVGAGPLPATAARDLLADSAFVRIRRVLVDPVSGHRLDTGVKRYLLTDAERDRILSRDRHCRFPDCTAPAIRCECDHATPYERDGATSTANLGAACKKHHQHKTHAGWQITASAADGSCTWRSPLGRSYVHEAQALLPWAVGDDIVDATPTDVVEAAERAGFEAIYDQRQGHLPDPNGCPECARLNRVLRQYRDLAWQDERRASIHGRHTLPPMPMRRSWLELHTVHTLAAPSF